MTKIHSVSICLKSLKSIWFFLVCGTSCTHLNFIKTDAWRINSSSVSRPPLLASGKTKNNRAGRIGLTRWEVGCLADERECAVTTGLTRDGSYELSLYQAYHLRAPVRKCIMKRRESSESLTHDDRSPRSERATRTKTSETRELSIAPSVSVTIRDSTHNYPRA